MDVDLVRSPKQQAELEADRRQKAEIRNSILAQLQGGKRKQLTTE